VIPRSNAWIWSVPTSSPRKMYSFILTTSVKSSSDAVDFQIAQTAHGGPHMLGGQSLQPLF
jgi:hypothetical protein